MKLSPVSYTHLQQIFEEGDIDAFAAAVAEALK